MECIISLLKYKNKKSLKMSSIKDCLKMRFRKVYLLKIQPDDRPQDYFFKTIIR